MRDNLANKRVFMICGHAHSGKTSLTEALLFKAKATSRLGKVEDGTSLSDYSEDEIDRKGSISSSFFSIEHKKNFLQFIDTPGYLDFLGEVISASFAADFMLIVVSASAGVGIGTERAWEIARARNLPCIFFINKLNKDDTDIENTIKDIRGSLTKKAVSLVYPVGKGSGLKDVVNILDKSKTEGLGPEDKAKAAKLYSQSVENIAESDDALLEKYLNTGNIDYQEITPALKKAIAAGEFFPIFAGSAASCIGIDTLLDSLCDIMPSSQELAAVEAKTSGGEEAKVERSVDAPFSAQVIKTISDPYVGQLSIFRVLSWGVKISRSVY